MLKDIDSLMEKYEIDALLATGSGFEDPNIFWLTGFRSGDRIIYFQNKGEKGLVACGFNTLERVEKESFIKKTYDLSEFYIQLLRENKMIADNMESIYGPMLSELFTGKTIGVPDNFPASYLIMLQQLGYDVKVVRDLLKEGRATKTTEEIKTIRKAGDITTGAISNVVEMIKNTTVGENKTLLYDGSPLSVGQVKLALEHFLLDNNAESSDDIILAVGEKAFDWHYLGTLDDKMKSDVPIILDVFPRLKLDRYIADVTRTIVKGKPTERVQQMFDAVQAAGDASIDAMTDGTRYDDVNLACFNTLKKHGFDSRRLNPDAVDGMTHGLGHGIGLDVHEFPSMYKRDRLFLEGHVMAIEPGVYLQNIGGVRIENDYVVKKGKAELLTRGLDNVIIV